MPRHASVADKSLSNPFTRMVVVDHNWGHGLETSYYSDVVFRDICERLIGKKIGVVPAPTLIGEMHYQREVQYGGMESVQRHGIR